MSNKLQLSIPRASVWLLRLAVDPIVSRSLQYDPVAFAAWYASIGGLLDWPAEVAQIQETERAKHLSLNRMMKLLSQVHYAFSGRTNAEHARWVLEGYAVHDWVRRNGGELIQLAGAMLEKLTPALAMGKGLSEMISPFAARLTELGRTLKLSALERDILSFAFLTTVSDELVGIFDQLAADRWAARALWTAVFNTTSDQLAKAMRPKSPLRLSGLLQSPCRRAQFASVSTFWVDLLAAAAPLDEAFRLMA